MGIVWTIIIGFVAGVIAKLITPGSNEPSALSSQPSLGLSVRSSPLGWAKLLWYSPGEGAGLVGAVVGAVIVLLIWGAIAARQTSSDLRRQRKFLCSDARGIWLKTPIIIEKVAVRSAFAAAGRPAVARPA